MGQVTIYLDPETEGKMNQMVKQSGISKSRWIAGLIREKTRRAVERIGEVEPLRIPGPVEVKLRYSGTDLAERHPFDGERIVRLDGRTVLFKGQDILDALRFVLA